ncbi:MAG: FAD-dependent oxidoreductase [Fimbriimonadales bacterium]
MSRVVVVGAGVVGLSTAYYAAKAGHEVVVLERESAAFEGTSHGNAGMVVPSHFVPLASPGMLRLGMRLMFDRTGPLGFSGLHRPQALSWIWSYLRHANRAHVEACQEQIRDWNLASKACYRDLASELGSDFGFTERGLLMHCRTDEALHEEAETAETARRLGLRAEVLTMDQARALNPGLEMAGAGAVHFVDDAQLSPPRFLAALGEALAKPGVQIRYGQEVTGFETAQGAITGVRTANETLPADRVVVAAGSWSTEVARLGGVRLNVLPGKGYGVTVPLGNDVPTVCAILVEARVAMTPTADGVRFTSGMIIGDHSRSVDQRRLARFQGSVADYMPSYPSTRFQNLPVWVGYRPCTSDGMPVVGYAGGPKNLLFATGHGMMGMSLGPGTGKRVAEMLEDAAA